jgi:hypothetical protein
MACVVAATLSGWWFARNLALYGDLLGFAAHLPYMGGGRETPFGPAELWAELEGLRYSFFAVFGWFNVTTDPRLHLVFAAALLGGAGGLVAGVVARPALWRQSSVPGMALLGLHALVVGGAFLYWTATVSATQGRLLFTALPGFAAFAVLGLAAWGGRRFSWLAYAVVALAFAGSALWTLASEVVPAYARPAAPVEAEVLAGSKQRYATFGEKIALLGYRLSPEEVAAGESLDLTLYWRALAAMETNYSLFVHVADDPTVRVAEFNSHPGLGNNPTRYWRPGELARDVISLRVNTGSPPGRYKVLLGWFDFASGARLALPGGEDWVVLQEITVAAPPLPAL